MKRLISAALVLLALAAAAFFFLKLRRFLPERARGAELAPAETIFFAQIPNARETARRVPQTGLFQIWREQEVQDFLEKPRRKAPWAKVWQERFDQLVRVAPGEMFIAITSATEARRSFVGGFSFAGTRRDAEALAEQIRATAGRELVLHLRSNWCLLATDGELLQAALERFDGKGGPALAGSGKFQQTIAPLGIGNDLVIYGNPKALSAEAGRAEPMAAATKIEGGKLHDTIFLPAEKPRAAASLPRQTLTLTSPQAQIYYATDLAALPPLPDAKGWVGMLPVLGRTEKVLGEKGLTWSDFSRAFGPELGVIVEWPENAALPMLLVGAEVRDRSLAGSFFEALTRPEIFGAAWREQKEGDATMLLAPPQGFSLVNPAVVLTERWALLGLSPEAVSGALGRVKSTAGTLAQEETYRDVTRFLDPQAGAMGYLDFPRLFERVYRMARPFLTLSLAFSPEAGTQFDAGKLPPAEAISKHLSPIVATQTQTAGGTLIESSGTVTVTDLFLGLAVGGLATAPPGMKSMLPGGLKLPFVPPAPAPEKMPADHK